MKIKNKIFLLTSSIITIIILCIFIFNKFFFEKYYLKIKEDKLLSIVNVIKDPNYIADFENIEEYHNIQIFLIRKSFLKDFDFNIDEREFHNIINNNSTISKLINKNSQTKKQILIATNYDDHSILIITSPFNSVKEPVNIITTLYLKYIFILLLVGYFLSIIVSRFISKPIEKMSKTAKKVALMNFSENFNSKSNDEIGELGKNLNIMENKLQENIDILKRDIERQKQTEQLRKEFISNISHELKTPLAIIQNYSEGLIENIAKTEKDKKEYLNSIIEETKTMNDFVSSLLFLSRSERNYLNFSNEEFKLEEILNVLLPKIKYIYPKINISLKLKDNLFHGDKEKMTIVIKNLLENACKYSKENQFVKIFIEKNYFEIKNFSDISEENLDNLWIPFYRMDKNRDRKNGTGLGLAIVKELLKKQNYKFGVYKKDENIVFWFQDNTN
ncbi:histidine kinase dimerization/phospho-acceptor domain-containing protein [Fusobacterium sp. MFO224]|uniref:HAMP domain-containing sensor histidine kinase n=1 Tax=Fusobacterium sp. MFO224 TaxID=3378070 RepID=UPI0038549131